MSTSVLRVDACEVLDSRGRPTVSTKVVLADGTAVVATVPSGASTGTHEAHELRDGGDRYGGLGTRRAVEHVITTLGPAIVGMPVVDQRAIDQVLIGTDGSDDLHRLGANATLSISVAAAMAAAASGGRPMYEVIAETIHAEPVLPMPMVNIVSGGLHAAGMVDVQDFLAVPLGARDVSEAIDIAAAIRAGTARVARQHGQQTALVADEGGLALQLDSNRGVLDFLCDGAELAGVHEFGIAIDVAAHQLATPGGYRLAAEGRALDPAAWVDELGAWVRDYPIVSIEDPLDEDDWDGWKLAARRLGGQIQLLGDDVFVTNAVRLRRGIDSGIANAVLVKPNQVGTLSAAGDVVEVAKAAGWATVVSARSGETEDSWLADLAVGWAAGQIKVGSTTRSERTAKWNRLKWIEHELGPRAAFAGRTAVRAVGPAHRAATT